MTESTTAGPRPMRPAATTENATIRPFRVEVPEEDLAELRRRIDATRWPSRELVTDRSQGVQLATMQKLARYWATDYDWHQPPLAALYLVEAHRIIHDHHVDDGRYVQSERAIQWLLSVERELVGVERLSAY
jgi:hypothetical protein